MNFNKLCTWCKSSSLKVYVNFQARSTERKFYSDIRRRLNGAQTQHAKQRYEHFYYYYYIYIKQNYVPIVADYKNVYLVF